MKRKQKNPAAAPKAEAVPEPSTALAIRDSSASPAVDVPAKRKLGRPTTLTQDIADRLFAAMATGSTITKFCRENPDVTLGQIVMWESRNEEFRERIARARELQTRAWADELVSMSEDPPMVTVPGRHGDYQAVDSGAVQLRKLRADNLKWLMARLSPKDFGDRLQHTGADGGPMQVMMAVWQSPQGKPEPESE